MNSEIIDFTLVTAIEGGSTHWVDHLTSPTLPFTLTDCEGDKHDITTEDFHLGWDLLLTQYPEVAGRIADLDGQADADDTDTLLQMVVFGDVVYA